MARKPGSKELLADGDKRPAVAVRLEGRIELVVIVASVLSLTAQVRPDVYPLQRSQ